MIVVMEYIEEVGPGSSPSVTPHPFTKVEWTKQFKENWLEDKAHCKYVDSASFLATNGDWRYWLEEEEVEVDDVTV